MGHYTAWIATGEPDPGRAKARALALISRYDEAENAIPGRWPGISFDYCETIAVRSVPESVSAITGGQPPSLLATADRQILPAPNREQTEPEPYLQLSYGLEEMVFTLLDNPDQQVVLMDWHS